MTRFLTAAAAFLILASPVVAANQGIDDAFFKEGGDLDAAAGPATDAAPSSAASGALPPIVRSGDAEPDIASTGIRVIGSLAFVSLLIIAIYRIARKTKLPFFEGEGIVKRVAVEPLGPNKFINIVEVGDRMLVLGITEKGITMLTELSGESREMVRMMNAGHRKTATEHVKSFGGVIAGLTGMMRDDEKLPAATGRRKEAESVLTESLARERKRIRESAL